MAPTCSLLKDLNGVCQVKSGLGANTTYPSYNGLFMQLGGACTLVQDSLFCQLCTASSYFAWQVLDDHCGHKFVSFPHLHSLKTSLSSSAYACSELT